MPKLDMEKDPRLWKPKKIAEDRKRCLGLDLGTNCGVAIVDFIPGQPVRKLKMVLGQWDLSLGPYDSGPLRHIRLKQFLAVANPDLLMYEEVKFTPSKDQMVLRGHNSIHAIVARVASAAEFLGGLKVTVTTWCQEHDIPAQGLAIAKIKKHATGKGNANKLDMIAACNEEFGTKFPVHEDSLKDGIDNMADAAFVCDIGVRYLIDGF